MIRLAGGWIAAATGLSPWPPMRTERTLEACCLMTKRLIGVAYNLLGSALATLLVYALLRMSMHP